MTVFVKLYATFRLKYNNYNPRRGIPLCLNTNAVVADVLEMINIDPGKVSLLFVNKIQIKDYSYPLQDGDILDIFPFVGGG